MTRETYKRLLEQKEEIRRKLRKTRAGLREAAGGSGEWHDNFAFEQAQREVDQLVAQLLKYTKILQEPQFIEPNQNAEKVGIGNTVRLKFEGDNEEVEYTILGPEDYGTRPTWIPFTSPVAQAILGRERGEVISFNPQPQLDSIKLKIVEIKPGDFE